MLRLEPRGRKQKCVQSETCCRLNDIKFRREMFLGLKQPIR